MLQKIGIFEPADDVFIIKVGPNAFGNDISALLDTLGYEKGNMCLWNSIECFKKISWTFLISFTFVNFEYNILIIYIKLLYFYA